MTSKEFTFIVLILISLISGLFFGYQIGYTNGKRDAENVLNIQVPHYKGSFRWRDSLD